VLVLLVFWAEVVLEDVDMVRRFRTDNGLVWSSSVVY